MPERFRPRRLPGRRAAYRTKGSTTS
jgi:hypothetical protein